MLTARRLFAPTGGSESDCALRNRNGILVRRIVLRPARARPEFLVANISRHHSCGSYRTPRSRSTNESGAQPEAPEDIPRHIRDVIGEALAGRRLELANLEGCATLAAREPLIKAQLGGDLHEALLAL